MLWTPSRSQTRPPNLFWIVNSILEAKTGSAGGNGHGRQHRRRPRIVQEQGVKGDPGLRGARKERIWHMRVGNSDVGIFYALLAVSLIAAPDGVIGTAENKNSPKDTDSTS